MDCSDVQESFSAYYDGELPDQLRRQISGHLDKCPECAHGLRIFGRLSAMVADLKTPPPPDQMWTEIARQLDQPTVHAPGKPPARSMQRYFAIAATVLVAIGIGWFTFGTWFQRGGHDHFAADFAHYLREFSRDPNAAQRFLLARYDGQSVNTDQVVQLVGYRPAVADGVPAGYTVESTNVLTMPCCRCVQTVCRRSDGSMIAIFEHDDEEPEWFADRPTTTAQCGGKTCRLVELGDRIAASWQRGNRHITVIGGRNVEEIGRFAGVFN